MTRKTSSARRPRRKVPAFVPVPVRARSDGWTPLRQAEFLGYLAETRSVTEAARRVNMARETAYRLRTKPGAESFAAAWDVAMGASDRVTRPASKVTGYELWHRAFHGLLQPLTYAGRYTGIGRKSDPSALLTVLARPVLVAGFGGRGQHGIFAPRCHPVTSPYESFTPPHRSAKQR